MQKLLDPSVSYSRDEHQLSASVIEGHLQF